MFLLFLNMVVAPFLYRVERAIIRLWCRDWNGKPGSKPFGTPWIATGPIETGPDRKSIVSNRNQDRKKNCTLGPKLEKKRPKSQSRAGPKPDTEIQSLILQRKPFGTPWTARGPIETGPDRKSIAPNRNQDRKKNLHFGTKTEKKMDTPIESWTENRNRKIFSVIFRFQSLLWWTCEREEWKGERTAELKLSLF